MARRRRVGIRGGDGPGWRGGGGSGYGAETGRDGEAEAGWSSDTGRRRVGMVSAGNRAGVEGQGRGQARRGLWVGILGGDGPGYGAEVGWDGGWRRAGRRGELPFFLSSSSLRLSPPPAPLTWLHSRTWDLDAGPQALLASSISPWRKERGGGGKELREKAVTQRR
jgi:hypothetical protein